MKPIAFIFAAGIAMASSSSAMAEETICDLLATQGQLFMELRQYETPYREVHAQIGPGRHQDVKTKILDAAYAERVYASMEHKQVATDQFHDVALAICKDAGF